MTFYILQTIIETAALLAGLLFYKNYKHTVLRWALPFLCFILATEATGWYIRNQLSHSNGMLYNFTIPLEYTFYFLIFRTYIQLKYLRRIMLIGWILLISYCISQYLSRGVAIFIPGILLVGNFLMILYCCFFFWQLFQVEEERPLLRIPIFWIFTGVFLFNLGELSYSLFAKIMFEQLDRYAKFFGMLINMLIIVLYGCFIISFSLKDTRSEYGPGN
jgi:hypothetical protein